jgi:alpha-glucoside transport system substrate-binding protein
MRSQAYRITLLGATLLFGAGLTLTACGGGSGGGSSSNSTTVTIWSSVDPPVKAGLEKELLSELKAVHSKINIQWETVSNINQLIITKIQAGDTPDIAYIPQPGVVAQMESLGAIHPLNPAVDMTSLQQNMVPGALQAGTINGKLYGLLGSANVKGLVWYNKPAWTKAGWQIPTSYPGLLSLISQMKAKGSATAPWCAGIYSAGGSAGWPATDWFETLMMRDYGPTAYNEWVTHKIKFVSPQLEHVAAQFAQLLFTPGNTYGSRTAIPTNGFDTAGNGLFTTPAPKCWMYMQGSFITGFFPTNVQSSLDSNVGVFYFPPTTAAGPRPVEGGGDMLTMLNDTPNVRAVVKLLSEPQIGDDAAPTSSFISPFKNFDLSLYPNDTTRAVASIMYKGDEFLFDASDAMPAQVGAGTFWTQMVAWVGNQESINTALANIDQSWPTSG